MSTEYTLKIKDNRTIELLNEFDTIVLAKSKEDEEFAYPAIKTLDQFMDNLEERLDSDMPSEGVVDNLKEVGN